MTDEELARESWWNDNNCSGALPTEKIYECGFLAGLKAGSQLDKVWHDYDAGEDCYEDSHEGKWVKREASGPKWHKVADGDLPNNDLYVWTNVGPAYYDDECHCWRTDYGRLSSVIAWCEPKYMEEK